jgi:hypothetical protein
VSTAAMLVAGWPPTVVNFPPIQAVPQLAGSRAMVLTMPLVLGLNVVILPVVPLKDMALLRVKVAPPSAGLANWANVPTVNMVPPQGVNCRT